MIPTDAFRAAALRGDSITVADLLQLHGRATWPALMLVLAVLCTLPIAGVGAGLSLPLFAIAARWPAWRPQRRPVVLPERLLSLRLGASGSARCLRALATVYDLASARLRRRWLSLRHPWTVPGWRLWIAAMAFVILLPLPLGNVLPAFSLVLLGLGWLYRDGLALMASLLTGGVALAYAALSAHWLVGLASAALA